MGGSRAHTTWYPARGAGGHSQGKRKKGEINRSSLRDLGDLRYLNFGANLVTSLSS